GDQHALDGVLGVVGGASQRRGPLVATDHARERVGCARQVADEVDPVADDERGAAELAGLHRADPRAVVDQHVVAAAVHREDRARPRVLVLGALLRARPAAAPVRPDAYLVLGVAQVPRHYRGLLAAPASPEPGAAAPTTGTRPS